MNKTLSLIISISMFFGILSCSGKKNEISYKALQSGFTTPPDSIQTSVYWYWISGNISKEGVIKDLHAMKKAGINRAFIGNIGLDDVPAGTVKLFSEEWWEILHAALKTATELNIDIGIFNSPGWSQSGGPWIEPEEAMRYLASSELRVKGPQKFSAKPEKPAEPFQDIRVIAFPLPAEYDHTLSTCNASITSNPSIKNLSLITDGNCETGINLPPENEFIIDFDSHEPFTLRSLSIYPNKHPILATATLQLKEADNSFRSVCDFEINRSNPSLNVGFNPYAPIVVSFPEITATSFRLAIKNANPGSGISEIVLSSSPRIAYYAEKTLSKMHQTPLPYWNAYKWPTPPEVGNKSLMVDASQVIDISTCLSKDGTLTWDVPEGEWIIMRTGMTPTGTTNAPAPPEATGYEVDKMSQKHIEKHFNSYIGEILKRIPEADRKTFKVVVMDSYETGGQNFTDNFLNEFKQHYGYDPLPFLPAYYGIPVNNLQESDRFLWDLRRLIADKVAYDYVGGLRSVSHKYGLTTWLENYGHWGFPGEFLMYGGQSDEIGGEFWSEGDLGDIENRAASSCGHIYGKNRISAESNTSSGNSFARYPAVIKQRADRFFAEGINNTLLHVYISQPYEDKNPGVNAWFGTEFNRKNTWFSQIDIYITYLKRVNFMLQQGLNVADVAYFIGEDAPVMTGITDPPLPIGYQFDYINAEVIEKYMTVKNGLLTLPHGTQYKILVLPKLETMRPELLIKIKQLIREGAIVMGPPPTRSPSLQNQPEADRQIQSMAKEIWGEVDGVNIKSKKFGKGMILNGLNMQEAFALINCIPDCQLPQDNSIHYGHRTLGNGEIYFLSNQTDKEQIVYPEFRITGKQPERWDPITGSIRPLSAYELKEKTTIVPLKLAPFESIFVVFFKKAEQSSTKALEANFPKPEVIAKLTGPWTVIFDSSQRGPEKPVIFEKLQDWSTSSDNRIKYYSGTAFYNKKFHLDELPGEGKIFLNLGELTAMAKVYVNDKYAGGVWTSPWQLDITNLVTKGENNLKVEVVNTWVNRLIGDLNLPKEQRKTWSSVNSHTADSPLQPSGLFGPVTISIVKY